MYYVTFLPFYSFLIKVYLLIVLLGYVGTLDVTVCFILPLFCLWLLATSYAICILLCFTVMYGFNLGYFNLCTDVVALEASKQLSALFYTQIYIFDIFTLSIYFITPLGTYQNQFILSLR